MKKIEMKRILKDALMSEFGFFPSLNDIQIIESDDTCTHVSFMVNGRYYRFDSYISTMGGMRTVWVGSGTIEKLPEHDKK